MYTKSGNKAIAKKRYSFRKGYLQCTLAQKKELREKLMATLAIKGRTYFSTVLNKGILNISISYYEAINSVFHEYGITDIWETTPE